MCWPSLGSTIQVSSDNPPDRKRGKGVDVDISGSNVPQWHVVGDWFDVCRCDIPCPCEFAQPPTDNWCEGVVAYHVREGNYGDIRLDGLSVIGLAPSRATFGLEKPRCR